MFIALSCHDKFFQVTIPILLAVAYATARPQDAKETNLDFFLPREAEIIPLQEEDIVSYSTIKSY